MRVRTPETKAAAEAAHLRIIAGIVEHQAATRAAARIQPLVQLTNDDEQWMDNPDAAINAGRFEADGFIPRNAVAPF